MFEIPDETPREASEPPSDHYAGGDSFQSNSGGSEVTPLVPSTESAITQQPDGYEPRAYAELREVHPERTGTSGERILDRPAHITVLDARGEPLPLESAQNYMGYRTIRLPHQAIITPDEKRLIDTTREGFKALAAEAGVDISGNAPPSAAQDYEAYHPYDNLETMSRDVAQTYHIYDRLDQGMQETGVGIIYSRDILPVSSKIARLTLQDMSRSVVGDAYPRSMAPPHGAVLNINGFTRRISNHGDLDWRGEALNEAAIEVTSARLGTQPWPEGYPGADHTRILTATVIDETVRRQGMTPKEMEDALVRGMVTNDHTVEEAIKASFGSEGIDEVLKLGFDMRRNDSFRIARVLGVEDLVWNIRVRSGADAADIYPWRNAQ